MKPLQIFLSLLFVLLAACHLLSQDRTITVRRTESVMGQKIAFLVGVTEYEDSGSFPTLSFTVKDVKAWQEQLEGIGFEPENIVVMASNTSVSRRPTKQRILTQLTGLLNKVGENDIIVCVFSGHGTQIGTEPYFCPEDANADQLAETCVSLNEVMDKMKQSPAKFKWMIVDACRNDPGKSLPGSVKSLGEVKHVPKGVTAIFSCAATEKSYENVTLGHGVFTHFLLEGLAGEAADENGDVTIMNLYSYVAKGTKKFVDDNYSQSQVPYWNGDFTDFVIHQVPPPISSQDGQVTGRTQPETQPNRTTPDGTVNYKLDLSQVTLGYMPTGWNGPNNAMVGNVGGSKCVTSNTSNSAGLESVDLFKQPGDWVLNFTLESNARSGAPNASGTIKDEKGNTISFQMSYSQVSFGDSPAKRYKPLSNGNRFSNTYTIIRKGNILSMTCEGLEGETIIHRSETFGSLIGFTVTIPNNNVGISHFAVHSFNGQSSQRPIEGYSLDLTSLTAGDQPPEGWHGLDNAVVNNIGGNKCITNSSDRNPVELVLTDHFNQSGNSVLNFTLTSNARSGAPNASGTIQDEKGNTISFQMSYSQVSFGGSPNKRYRPSSNGNIFSNRYTITRAGNVFTMTCEGLEGEAIIHRSDTFGSLTGFTITIPNNNVGISQFSANSLGDLETAIGGGTRGGNTGQGTSSGLNRTPPPSVNSRTGTPPPSVRPTNR